MNILIADDEMMMREDLKYAVERVTAGSGNTYYFAKNFDTAMEQVKNHPIEVAFLDINMPGKSGLELAKAIKNHNHDINIIMVTAYREYALDALRLYVSGYLLKPVNDSELKEALGNLRKPVAASAEDKMVKAVCFGNFEVFIGGRPIVFFRQKEKELLAYLICLKGASATRREICASLFEEKNETKSNENLKKIIQALKKDLTKYQIENILVHNRNSYSVNTALIACDYYDFLDRKPGSEALYHGSFLNQYSWAEIYIYELENY